jgi:hypothetical protein
MASTYHHPSPTRKIHYIMYDTIDYVVGSVVINSGEAIIKAFSS